MTNVQRFHAHGTQVDAVQVPDELTDVMWVAAWVHNNGGRVNDPVFTRDYAFHLSCDGASIPVSFGDWVLRFVADGTFAVWAHDKFEAAFKPVEVAS
jgi:hypothetical protein